MRITPKDEWDFIELENIIQLESNWIMSQHSLFFPAMTIYLCLYAHHLRNQYDTLLVCSLVS